MRGVWILIRVFAGGQAFVFIWTFICPVISLWLSRVVKEHLVLMSIVSWVFMFCVFSSVVLIFQWGCSSSRVVAIYKLFMFLLMLVFYLLS